MAGIDNYAPCPCGSGEKYKWCCQKVEPFAERAQRLFDSGQSEAAIEALVEGLRKHPDNAWLLIRKALIEIRDQKTRAAADTLRRLVVTEPKHLAARILLARAVLESEGPASASAHLQNALGLAHGKDRIRLAGLYRMVGVVFAHGRNFPAAIRHLDQASALDPADSEADELGESLSAILSNPGISPYLKDLQRLAPPPADLPQELAVRFAEALALAEAGAWNSAAAAFESLSANGGGPMADHNLGLLRLWVADDSGAVQAFRRCIPKLGNTTEAVDLEAICQIIAEPSPEDKIDLVQLIWPLKNRDALLDKLRAQPDVIEEGPAPIDGADPKSPEVQWFLLLDRKALPNGNGANLKPTDLPKVIGQAFVGKEIAGVEAVDGPGLGALTHRFTSLGAPAIPPSHPKTKVVGESSRLGLTLAWDWHYPEGIEQGQIDRLRDEQQATIIRDVWPKTKLPYLGNRTPLEAVKAGDSVVALRAAVCLFETQFDSYRAPIDFKAVRAKLNLPDEPEIDPAGLDVESVRVSRLRFVPVDRLDDLGLVAYYRRARKVGLSVQAQLAARRLADRPDLRKQEGFTPLQIFGDIASYVAANGDNRQAAIDWLRRGRTAEDAKTGPASSAAWDMFEVRLVAPFDPPEQWVPELAAILDRYRDSREADQTLMLSLVGMGLLQIAPNHENPEQVLVDSRPLQMLMDQYGPRITTSSGRLGVSATKPEVWTPDSRAGGSTTPGGIWTPGSSQGSGGDKPKLIIPGR